MEEENAMIPDERRHGTTLHRAPTFVLIAHLLRKGIERLKKLYTMENIPAIPCLEWLRVQFTPQNPWCKVAYIFTSRFNMKMGLQTRLLRKSHPDQKYGTILFHYFKAFSVMFREESIMFFLDDKCSIPIGSPQNPVSIVCRQKRVMGGGGLSACDHDYIQMHVTPSVVLKMTPPRSVTQSFYGGAPFIILKDAIFEASSAMRHMSEL